MNSLTITHYNFDPVTIICLDQILSVVMNCFSPPTGSCFFFFFFSHDLVYKSTNYNCFYPFWPTNQPPFRASKREPVPPVLTYFCHLHYTSMMLIDWMWLPAPWKARLIVNDIIASQLLPEISWKNEYIDFLTLQVFFTYRLPLWHHTTSSNPMTSKKGLKMHLNPW